MTANGSVPAAAQLPVLGPDGEVDHHHQSHDGYAEHDVERVRRMAVTDSAETGPWEQVADAVLRDRLVALRRHRPPGSWVIAPGSTARRPTGPVVVGGLQDLPYLDHFDVLLFVDVAGDPDPQELRRMFGGHGLLERAFQPDHELVRRESRRPAGVAGPLRLRCRRRRPLRML